MDYFPFDNPLSHRCKVANLSLFYRYFNVKYHDELHSIVPLVQTFTPKTHHAIYAGRPILIPFTFHLSQEPLHYRMDSSEDDSPNNIYLIAASLGLTITYRTYSHNRYSLKHTSYVHTPNFSNP